MNRETVFLRLHCIAGRRRMAKQGREREMESESSTKFQLTAMWRTRNNLFFFLSINNGSVLGRGRVVIFQHHILNHPRTHKTHTTTSDRERTKCTRVFSFVVLTVWGTGGRVMRRTRGENEASDVRNKPNLKRKLIIFFKDRFFPPSIRRRLPSYNKVAIRERLTQ